MGRAMVISVILGTRPEIIKLAPIIHEARRRAHEVRIIFTGQHQEISKPLLELFDLIPDVSLEVMEPSQSLTGLSTKVLARLSEQTCLKRCDLLLVQGDTTSAFVGAYWGFCNQVHVGHVEAGLRTYDLSSPFPEEGNRQLISRIAKWHFAPTLHSAQKLKQEGVESTLISIVGNTGIDAIQYVIKKLKQDTLLERKWVSHQILDFVSTGKLILVTAHRRESFGVEFEKICKGILEIAQAREDVRILFPVHPNPHVRRPVEENLTGHPRIFLCEPLGYIGFVSMMRRAHLLLTDSGGVQEEGPSFGKRILVMRSNTERPEGVDAGFSKLVGTDSRRIYQEAVLALDSDPLIEGQNPYGDGNAAIRVLSILEQTINVQTNTGGQLLYKN